jgi:hypothetical protein
MARQLTPSLQTIRTGVMAGVVALIRAGDAVGEKTTRIQRMMREFVDEARRRALGRRAVTSEPQRFAASEGPRADTGEGAPVPEVAAPSGGDVPETPNLEPVAASPAPTLSEEGAETRTASEEQVRIPDEQSVTAAQSSEKRREVEAPSTKHRGAHKGRAKKRRPE